MLLTTYVNEADCITKLVRQSQIVQSAMYMYNHIYNAVIIRPFLYNSCHSLLVLYSLC